MSEHGLSMDDSEAEPVTEGKRTCPDCGKREKPGWIGKPFNGRWCDNPIHSDPLPDDQQADSEGRGAERPDPNDLRPRAFWHDFKVGIGWALRGFPAASQRERELEQKLTAALARVAGLEAELKRCRGVAEGNSDRAVAAMVEQRDRAEAAEAERDQLRERVSEIARWIESGLEMDAHDDTDPLDAIADRLSAALDGRNDG